MTAALIGLPAAILSGVAALVAGRFAYRYGRTIVVGSLVCVLVGMISGVALAVLVGSHGASVWWLVIPGVFLGVGQGTLGASNQTMALNEVPPVMGGAAAGVKKTVERICSSIGHAVVTSAFFATIAADGWVHAYEVAMAVLAFFIACSLLIALRDRQRHGSGYPDEIAA